MQTQFANSAGGEIQTKAEERGGRKKERQICVKTKKHRLNKEKNKQRLLLLTKTCGCFSQIMRLRRGFNVPFWDSNAGNMRAIVL